MKYTDLRENLEKRNIRLFTLDDLVKLCPAKRSVLKQQVYYWRKRGWVGTVKRGLYELTYSREKALSDLFVANRLYAPSYVSLETALSHYSIIPEVAMGVTSVTTKPTREFRNRHGFFRFRTVKKHAFQGYGLIEDRGQKVKIAEPEKAFVDTLYFNLLDGNPIDLDVMRIDRARLEKMRWRRIRAYARLFSERLAHQIEALCSAMKRS